MPQDWRDNLQTASIGSAELFVSDVRTSGGRRVVVTELPARDKPVNEDMGRAAWRYQVTAFVIGDEYMKARDNVMDVLSSEGPHDFVHPFQGTKSVVLDGAVEVSESDSEGGWARLSFALVESGEPDGLRVYVSSAAALAAAADAGVAAGAGDLKKGLAKVGIGSIFAAVSGALDKASRAMLIAKRNVFGALGVGEFAKLSDSITNFKDTANRLLSSPAELMSAIHGIVSGIMSIIASFDDVDSAAAPYPGGAKAVRAEAALAAAQELAQVDLVTPPAFPGAPVDEDAQEAERAVGKALRVATVCGTASLLQTLPLESQATATEALGIVGALAELVLVDETTSDELFVAMTDLRAALDQHLAGLTAELPSVQEYTPPTTLPALLVAYRFYRDPLRDLEICGRNGVADPNFLRGGAVLQVLDG